MDTTMNNKINAMTYAVLVVDDEEINREILGGILEDDYEVLYAGNGEEALEILKKTPIRISLVLLDLVMPVMDGFEFIEKTSADPKLRKIPIIVLTSDRSAEVRSLTMGAADFIPKPYNMPEVILARVKRTIDIYKDRSSTAVVTEHDGLTGLFTKGTAKKLTDAHLSDGGHGVFFIIDLDNFKYINDTFGHLYGDDVLIKVAECIKQNTGSLDIPSRFGGDEFMIFYPDMNIESAEAAAEAFFGSLRSAFENEKASVTCSVGISEAKPFQDYNALFEETDKALYESKKNGKNKYTVRK